LKGLGDTLSTTGAVWVVRDPLAGYGNTVEASPGLALNNVVVGVFIDPDPGDQSGEYTAIINWGDGTAPTSGEVIGSEGLFEVLASHAYTTGGLYTPTVQVEWGDPQNALLMMAKAAVSGFVQLSLYGMEGPMDVPGNSVYQYQVSMPAGTKLTSLPPNKDDWTIGPNTKVATEFAVGRHFNKDGTVDWTAIQVGFKNQPAAVQIKLKLNLNGAVEPFTLPVNVVQVKVSVPVPLLPFIPGTPSATPLYTQRYTNIVENLQSDTFAPPDHLQTSLLSGGQTSIGLPGDPPAFRFDTPALRWSARVTLIGPGGGPNGGGAGVGQINGGFIQHATDQKYTIGFDNGMNLVDSGSVAPQTYLDTGASGRPWYSDVARGTLDGAITPSKMISSSDQPFIVPPLQWPVSRDKALFVAFSEVFRLDVAAVTVDTAFSSDGPYWAESIARQQNGMAGWSVDLTGDINLGNKNEPWRPIKGLAGVVAPSSWVPPGTPTFEYTGGKIANDVPILFVEEKAKGM
jgi:hypothetical protein